MAAGPGLDEAPQRGAEERATCGAQPPNKSPLPDWRKMIFCAQRKQWLGIFHPKIGFWGRKSKDRNGEAVKIVGERMVAGPGLEPGTCGL